MRRLVNEFTDGKEHELSEIFPRPELKNDRILKGGILHKCMINPK